MSLAAFLTELRQRDVQLIPDGDRLRCNAPAGALTPELQEQLRNRKAEILDFLRTAEAVARLQRAIVPMQPYGTRTPLFAVPGHNGDVFAFRDLARHIGNDQPFYGMHPQGLDENSEPPARVEDHARYFADEIQTFRPKGPYIIAGYCAGGAVALELARELEKRGATVSFLALFGCIYPTSYRFVSQIPYWIHRMALHVQMVAKPSSFAERRQYLASRLAARLKDFRAQRAPEGTDTISVLKFRFEQVHGKAVLKYSPRRYSGRVCAFWPHRAWLRARDDALRWGNAELGWRSVTPHIEDYYGSDNVDPDRMLIEPDAPVFADLFRRCRDGNATELTPRARRGNSA